MRERGCPVNTAGPECHYFVQHCFVIKLMRKITSFLAGATVCMKLAHSPGTLVSFPLRPEGVRVS